MMQSPLFTTRKTLTGSISGDQHKNIGYVSLHANVKTNETQPDYIGIVNIKGVGTFAMALWESEKTVIVKKVNQI